jgi:hypothetical protein
MAIRALPSRIEAAIAHDRSPRLRLNGEALLHAIMRVGAGELWFIDLHSFCVRMRSRIGHEPSNWFSW